MNSTRAVLATSFFHETRTRRVISFASSLSAARSRRRICTEAIITIIRNNKSHSKFNHQKRSISAAAAKNEVQKRTMASSSLKSSSLKKNALLRAGAPFVLFSVLAAWVVSNAVDGKLREMEVSQGKTSQSLRQAALEKEHEEMMERLGKIVEQDFDNTKRIKRPQEILEERKRERQRRNAWHRRAYRAVFGDNDNTNTDTKDKAKK